MPRSTRAVQVLTGVLIAGVFLVVAGVLGALVVSANRTGLTGQVAAAAVVIVFAVAAGISPWLSGIALGVAWLAAIGQMLAGLPVLPADVAVLMVLFTTGASRSPRIRALGIVSATVGAFVAAVYLAVGSQSFDSVRSFLLAGLLFGAALVMLVLSWTFGFLFATQRRAREAQEAAVVVQREAIAEQERGRIARDMHDVVAHSLAVIVAQADGARYLVEDERSSATLSTIAAVGREALGDVRVLLERLRHSQGELPQLGAAELPALVEQVRAAGLDVTYVADGLPARLPAPTDLALYRIVQESLTNVLRHGDPSGPVRIAIAAGAGVLRVEVRSLLRRGVAPGEPGHGLVGMRERARLAGGEFDAGAVEGEFVVNATVALGDESAGGSDSESGAAPGDPGSASPDAMNGGSR